MAAPCRQAKIEFITASEEVPMLDSNAPSVDSTMDEKMGIVLDDLLDLAAEDCLSDPSASDGGRDSHDDQKKMIVICVCRKRIGNNGKGEQSCNKY